MTRVPTYNPRTRKAGNSDQGRRAQPSILIPPWLQLCLLLQPIAKWVFGCTDQAPQYDSRAERELSKNPTNINMSSDVSHRDITRTRTKLTAHLYLIPPPTCSTHQTHLVSQSPLLYMTGEDSNIQYRIVKCQSSHNQKTTFRFIFLPWPT